VPVPAGETRTLRIAVLDAAPGAHAVGISTLGISGVAPTRTLVVPSAGLPDLLTFHTEPGARADCLTVNGRAACDASFAASGEEDGVLDRTFTLPGAQRYAIRATLTPRPGKALGARLDAGSAIGATASSVDSTDPRERPGAAVDGDQRTSWVAQVGDQQPSLVLNLGRLQPVRWLQLTVDPGAPVARPTRIRISAGAHAWTFAVGSGGIVRLPRAVTTKTLRLTVLNAELRQTISSTTGKSRLLPAGISEITINGAPNQASAGAVKIGCSDGVDALVDGIPIPLWATATRDQLLSGAEIAATPCSGASADLQSGVHRVRLAASPLLEPDSITLARGAIATSPGDAGSAAPLHWGATLRTVRVAAAAPALLVVRENANAGWRATLGGHRLSSVRLDGWQQGWIVPAGAAGIITLSYTPQSTFEVGLLAGLLAALAVVALMLVPARRRDVPGVGDRVFGTRWLAAGSMIAAFLLAGVTALAIGAAVYGLFWTMRRLGRVVPWWASGVAVVLAGCVEAYAPSGSARHPLAGSPGVQALCLAALCLMVTGSAVERRHGLEKRRSSGRSNQYQDAAPSTVAEPAVSRKYSG
jgi:arabinofuranan 3-O-arabinosyltransferase